LDPNSRPAGPTPFLIPENREYVLYRIESDPPRPKHPLDAHSEGGVFLYWRTTRPISSVLKVFVHVMDAAGRLYVILQTLTIP
jgi:hypothetical protein